MENVLTDRIMETLRAVDTPTVCNAIELVLGRRTAEGFTRRPVVAAHPQLPSLVGYARTGVLKCSAPAQEEPGMTRQRRIDYYRYVADGPIPAVVVLEDQDAQPGLGAFWGEVNVAIHKGLGALGVLTNGSVRDLGAIDPDFQVLAGSLTPSHAFVHLTAFGGPVEVFGLSLRSGDIVHADRHGAVRLEPEMVSELPRAIDTVTRKEAVILRAARAPGFTVDKLISAWGEAEDVH